MSQPELSEMLTGEDPLIEPLTDEKGAPVELSADEEFINRHFVTAAAMLINLAKAYPQLLERRRREGPSAEVRAEAHVNAEQAATVLQSMRRRKDLLVAAQETPLNPMQAIAVLDQLFFSYCLLSGPDDGLERAAWMEHEPEQWIEALDVRPWLEMHGAE